MDAVTLAELEEKGMVEQPAGSGSTETTTTTTPPKKTDPSKIGPGPSSPPADTKKD
ncbi:hypothetical protein O7622_25295 [Micromonospora sp. WMMD1076]|uniref:hypothetical protein n=1 Tax=Micromonospora sp. WMMD1076 TaxID=3016103 RepID=UPI00249B1114|nr:hypothetical protein [Micromonospora sp. WMMD1076]WFF06336.1 hypothetical protein O7622_25295 [Micromonospora sp. WMMD1076]